MKSFLIRFSFLPFALALLWGGKMMWQKVSASPNPDVLRIAAPTVPTTKPDHKVQLALLLDISGSMNGLIRQAQARLWQVVNELSHANLDGQSPYLEISLYVYGGDHLDPQKGYVQQLTPFTTDLDHVSAQLFALGTNGGEEYCAEVIHAAMTELSWSSNPRDLKLMFIAGNEAFNQGPRLFTQVCPNANERGIIVNTIYCGPYEQGISLNWDKGAALAGGQYLSINHNQDVVDIPTPFDGQFAQLNTQLNQTFVYYGSEGKLKAANQLIQDSNAGSLSLSASCDRAQSKVSKGYFRSAETWDLVEACKNPGFQWETLDRKTLPEEYKNYSTKELETMISQKNAERQRLQTEIGKLTQQRQAFLEQNQLKTDEGLDKALVQCLQTQATAKGYTFEK